MQTNLGIMQVQAQDAVYLLHQTKTGMSHSHDHVALRLEVVMACVLIGARQGHVSQGLSTVQRPPALDVL